MIPISIMAKFLALRGLWKRAERSPAAERLDRVIYQPPSIGLRGIGKVILLLLATHGAVYWYSNRHALANFAAKAKQVADKQRADDRKIIADLSADLERIRRQSEDDIAAADVRDRAAIDLVRKYQALAADKGWTRETVAAINGTALPPPATKGKRK